MVEDSTAFSAKDHFAKVFSFKGSPYRHFTWYAN